MSRNDQTRRDQRTAHRGRNAQDLRACDGRRSGKSFQRARKAKEAGADLVEWRADFFEELSDTAAAEQALLEISRQLGETPLLFTIRTKEEGGNRQISTKDYVNLNLAAARTKKADLIDVELFRNEEEMTALIKELQKEGAVVVASTHNFEKTDDKETLKSRFSCHGQVRGGYLKNGGNAG